MKNNYNKIKKLRIIIFSLGILIILQGCASLMNDQEEQGARWSREEANRITATRSSEINDVFENMVVGAEPVRKCKTANDCDNSRINYVCLKCPGGKLIVSRVEVEPPYIVKAPENEGMCAISVGMKYKHFKEGWVMPAQATCMIEFDGKEALTAEIELKEYAEIWKQFILRTQGISDRYFKEHITVDSFNSYEGENGMNLNINYMFAIDWMKLECNDHFLIKRKGESKLLTATELNNIPASEDGLKDKKPTCKMEMKIREIEKIVSKEEIRNSMQKCKGAKWITENEEVMITSKGKLIATGRKTVDIEKNECWDTQVDAETGELLKCERNACFYT